MHYDSPLVQGTLLKRYKRFLADVRLETGEEVTAHCANPGSMTGLQAAGAPVWLSRSDNPKRKLAYSWELVSVDGTLVNINTARPNALVTQAIAAGTIAELRGYASIRREVRYADHSRLDLLLEDKSRPPAYVEIKSVTLSREHGLSEFPDTVTARGAKHMDTLAKIAKKGTRAVIFFLIGRTDAQRFAVAGDIDPGYARAFRAATDAGVEALCYGCRISHTRIEVDKPVPVTKELP